MAEARIGSVAETGEMRVDDGRGRRTGGRSGA